MDPRIKGVPFGRRSPRYRGPYSTPIHTFEPIVDLQQPSLQEVRIGKRSYVSAAGLARLLKVSQRTLMRWHEARIGPPRTKIGKTVLYDIDKLPAWLEKHETLPVRLGTRER